MYHSQRHLHITPHDNRTSRRTKHPISPHTAASAPTPTHPQIVEARAGYTHLRGVCAASPWNPAPRGIPACPRPTITARRQHAAGTDYADATKRRCPRSSTRCPLPAMNRGTGPGRSVMLLDVGRALSARSMLRCLLSALHRCIVAHLHRRPVSSLYLCLRVFGFPLSLSLSPSSCVSPGHLLLIHSTLFTHSQPLLLAVLPSPQPTTPSP